MFTVESITNAGGRERNEDAYGSRNLNGTTCWVVADGLGGIAGGEDASRVAVDAVIESFERNPALDAGALRAHMQSAHEAILARQGRESDRSNMQSTLVILVSDGWRAIWAHVGDSRLYHIRAGKIVFRTRDHSLTQMKVDAGDLPACQLRHDPDRNKLLRAAGISGEFTPSVRAEPEQLARGDGFLLCVDGFWDKVMDTEVEIDSAKSASAKDWLRAMRRRVYERLSADADNFTATAIRSTNPDLPLPALDVSSGRATATMTDSPVLRLALAVLITVALSSLLAIRLIRPYSTTARMPVRALWPAVPKVSPVPPRPEPAKDPCADLEWSYVERWVKSVHDTGDLSFSGKQLTFEADEGEPQTFNLADFSLRVTYRRLDLHPKSPKTQVTTFKFREAGITAGQKACLLKIAGRGNHQ